MIGTERGGEYEIADEKRNAQRSTGKGSDSIFLDASGRSLLTAVCFCPDGDFVQCDICSNGYFCTDAVICKLFPS